MITFCNQKRSSANLCQFTEWLPLHTWKRIQEERVEPNWQAAISDQHFRVRGRLFPKRRSNIHERSPGVIMDFPILFSGGELNLSGDDSAGLKQEGVIR